jgi:hypothetical protein
MNTLVPIASPFVKFGEFLHASIHEEPGGMPLTVLSALARREIDAWEFAARLDVEPVQNQVREMSALIAALPLGIPPAEAPDHIVRRLIALLPGERRMAPSARLSVPGEAAQPAGMVGSLELIVGGVFFALLSMWVFGGLVESAPVKTTTTAASAAAAAPPSVAVVPETAAVAP